MKKNINNILTLSAFIVQVLCSTRLASMGTTSTMDYSTQIDAITQAQKANYNANYIGDPTIRSLATSIGCPNIGTSYSQPLCSIVEAISSTVNALPNASVVQTAANAGAQAGATTAINNSGFSTNGVQAACYAALGQVGVTSSNNIQAAAYAALGQVGVTSSNTVQQSAYAALGQVGLTSSTTAQTAAYNALVQVGLSTSVSAQQAATNAITSAGLNSSGIQSSAQTGATAAINAAITANTLPSLSSILLPLKLRHVVDNIIENMFSYGSLGNGNFVFPKTSSGTSLQSNGSTGPYFNATTTATISSTTGPEYQIISNSKVISLFDPVYSQPFNIEIMSPAQQLTIFLRAVFGINYTTFQGFSFSSSSGLFGYGASDQEDSGTVLTAVFDYVLGTARDGTTGSPHNTWGGSGIFNRINLGSSTRTVKINQINYPITGSAALTTPSAYFTGVGITSTTSAADIARLKALLTDLIIPNNGL